MKEKIKYILIKLKEILAEESDMTKHILSTYGKYLVGTVKKEDINKANANLIEILKALGVGSVILLPFSFFILPILVKIGRWLGVELLPEHFKSKF
jgi:hypothetical protein